MSQMHLPANASELTLVREEQSLTLATLWDCLQQTTPALSLYGGNLHEAEPRRWVVRPLDLPKSTNKHRKCPWICPLLPGACTRGAVDQRLLPWTALLLLRQTLGQPSSSALGLSSAVYH